MATNTNYRAIARQAAQANGVPPDVFERQIQQESGFNPGARSGAGAIGIAQFMPGTAAGLGINPNDPVQALHGAAKLMGSYIHKYGNVRDALVAYNAGPGKVGGPLPLETQNYLKTILGAGGKAKAVKVTGGPPKPSMVSGVSSPAVPDAGATNPASARRAALQNYVLTEHSDPNALLSLAFNLNTAANTATVHGTPAPPTTVRAGLANRRQTAGGTAPGGVVDFEGHKVAGWIAPVLQYARKNGWKGTVTSGFRTDAQQTQIYNSGVRPAAVPKSEGGSGSNHEGSRFPLGAVDVSNAQQLSQILQKSPYASKLVYAGAKDPVHFSHPHGGGY